MLRGPMPKDPAAIRAKILADPNIATIAEKLHVENMEEFIDKIVHYAMNPSAEPQLYVVEDEDLIKAGFTPPNGAEIEAYMNQAIATFGAHELTAFDQAKQQKVAMPSVGSNETIPAGDPKLIKEMREAKTGKHNKP